MKNFYFKSITKLNFTIFIIAALSSFFGISQTSIITSTGSWICPKGVTSITVQAYGGGGGGGYGGTANGDGGGGGGGGGFHSATFNVTPDTSYLITIGSGGSGGLTAGANGNDGTATTAVFDNGSINADFGKGGRSYLNGGSGGNGGSGTTRNGGTGGNGNGTASGSGGGCGGTISNGTNGTNGGAGGAGGGGSAGKGGDGITANSSPGNIGANYGGGGSGGTKNDYGGNGANGYMIITFTCPSNTIFAGTDQNLAACSTTTSLNATPVSFGTGTWSLISGTGTIASINSPTSTVTGITPGTTTILRWTVSNGDCGSSFDEVTINAPIGSSCLTYCTPSVSAGGESLNYFTNISFVGTLLDTSNNSTYSSAPRGYQNFANLTPKSIQARGNGINISMQMTNRGFVKAWVDWDRNGIFDDPSERIYDTGGILTYSTTFGFIIPAGQALGDYTLRVRINKESGSNTFGPCGNIAWYGETEDYRFTVIDNCTANITSVIDGTICGSGSVVLDAIGSGSPTQYRWYANEFGGSPLATTATGTWNTPPISSTTDYWVTCFNGCESLIRTKITAIVNPVASLTFTTDTPEICGENHIMSITATGDTQETYLVNEKFEGGLGTMSQTNYISNGATIDAKTTWQSRTSTFQPAEQVWFPAIASGVNGNKFVMSNSDVGAYIVDNSLITNTLNSSNFTNLTLSFDIFFSRYFIDGSNLTIEYVTVDISTNGGTTWTEIDRYTSDIGYGTRFVNKTYNLNTYINQPNLKARIRYYADRWCDGVAVDNFKIWGNVPLVTTYEFSSTTPVDAFLDAACTIPYTTSTSATTIYIRPTLLQLEQGSYSFDVAASLSNGCDITQTLTINNKSKVWKGGTSNDWNNPNNWLPIGVPNANSCVIISPSTNSSNIIGTNYNAYAKNLTVKNGGILNNLSTNNLTVTDWINVNTTGTFNIENRASLIQINNVTNTGNINMKRNTSLKLYDYVQWSSPVANFSSGAICPANTSYLYKYLSTVPTNVNGHGTYVYANENMTTGKGYLVGAPLTFTSTPQTYTATFTGVPNNGNITIPISRGTYDGVNYNTGLSPTLATKDDDNWNLLGNPYPSSIDAVSFLSANPSLAGFVYLWTHGTSPSSAIDPFYNDYGANYYSSDFLTYNSLGGTQFGYDGKIAAGQGFFTLMLHTSPLSSTNAIFNNSMRSNTFRNDQFFRSENGNTETKSRIWLKLVSPENVVSNTLIGFSNHATNDLDRMYDANGLGSSSCFEIYSLLNNEQYSIQGKGLPFNNNDSFDLGVKTPRNGNYTIAIDQLDGFISNEEVYLKDIEANVIHDLKTSPYTFTSSSLENNNRFKILFKNSTLNENTLENTDSNTYLFINENINIKSSKNIIEINVFDINGKLILSQNNISTKHISINEIIKNNSSLIVNIKLEDNSIKSFKTIY